MGKPRVFITRRLPEELLTDLKAETEITMWDEELIPVPRERLIAEAQHADGLLTMLSDKIDQELLDQAPHLKVVTNLAVGYDNIDLELCTQRGIVVCHTPDVLTETTADLTFALLMATARRLVESAEYVKSGEWSEWGPFLLAGSDIHHKILGIVGMGRIGSAVAKRGTGFEMDIIYHNRSRNNQVEEALGAKYVSFETLLKTADYVVNLTPLTNETHEMFNARAFQLMKNDAMFINVGRGKSVDEKALFEALKGGEIAAAGLDVFSEEPISKDHPLLSLKQVVALPHIGSASAETRTEMVKLVCNNILAVLVRNEKASTAIK